jgi:hypothetical protein
LQFRQQLEYQRQFDRQRFQSFQFQSRAFRSNVFRPSVDPFCTSRRSLSFSFGY